MNNTFDLIAAYLFIGAAFGFITGLALAKEFGYVWTRLGRWFTKIIG